MQFSDYISIIALIISMSTAVASWWFGLRDSARIKTTSEFWPEAHDEDAPYSSRGLRISIANHGRRVVYLEYLYFQYGPKKIASYAETLWDSDESGRTHLREGDKFEQFFDDDCSCFKDDDGNKATGIFFQDSLGRRYHVKDAGRNLKAYFASTAEVD
jgi:hypothetical protein